MVGALPSPVILKGAKASIDDLLVSFAAGDATWEGTASNVILKKDTWTEVTMTFTGWPQLPIFRGFYFGIAIDQEALTSVTTPIEFFFDSGKYL
jgi:hypothetical protein